MAKIRNFQVAEAGKALPYLGNIVQELYLELSKIKTH